MDHAVCLGADLRHHLHRQNLNGNNVKTILHLTVDGSQFWRKSGGVWQQVEAPNKGAVWVVSDLAEESLTELQIPRLFGRDRTNYIERQLASRFPDTPYKSMLAAATPSGLLDRIAPTRQSLLALEAKDQVNSALDGLKASVAGVWTTSGLLALLGTEKSLPADLFLVMPSPQSMRIMFLKNRVPIISRMVRDSGGVTSLVTEIVRTLRHLENTKVLERDGGRRPVLVLSQDGDLVEAIGAEQLSVIEAPVSWQKMTADDFKFALFELVMQSPPGQLAPLVRRTGFIASRVRTAAYVLSAASVCASIALALADLAEIRQGYAKVSSAKDHTTQIAGELAIVMKAIAEYPVSADILKSTLQIEKDEILAAPSMESQLRQLSIAIADPSLRVSSLDWAVNTPPTTPCKVATTGPASAEGAASPDATEKVPRGLGSRISFELTLPPGLDAKTQTAVMAGVSQRLAKIPGLTLDEDPVKQVSIESLAGGIRKTVTSDTKAPVWCVTIAGDPGRAPDATIAKP
jgi:hypothetical protein